MSIYTILFPRKLFKPLKEQINKPEIVVSWKSLEFLKGCSIKLTQGKRVIKNCQENPVACVGDELANFV